MENPLWYPARQMAKYLACAILIVLVSSRNLVLAGDASRLLSTQAAIPAQVTTSQSEFAKLPLCTLNLTLTGTITGTSKQALISVNGHKDEPFTTNQVITDDVVLVDVYSRGVVVRRHGVLEKLELRSGGGLQEKNDANNKLDSAPISPAVIEASVRPQPDNVIQKQNNDSQTKKLKFMGKPFEPTDLFTQAKIISEADGLQIVETVSGGLYEHLGLQGGDKILAINGESVNSLLDVISLAQKKDGTNRTQATFVRHGNLYSVELDPARGIESRMIIDPAQIEK